MSWHPRKWRVGLIAIAIFIGGCGGDETETVGGDKYCVPSDVRLVRPIEPTSQVNGLFWTGNALIWTRQIKSPTELEGVTFEPVGEQDLAVIAVDRDGASLWTAQLSDGRPDARLVAFERRAHPAGGLLIAAQGIVGTADVDNHVHIWRINDSGATVWQQTFPGIDLWSARIVGDASELTYLVGTANLDGQIHDLPLDASLGEEAGFVIAIDGMGNIVASNYLGYDSQTAAPGGIHDLALSGTQFAVAQSIASHPSLVLFDTDGGLVQYHSWDDGDDSEAYPTSVVRTKESLFVSGLARRGVLSLGGIPLTERGDLADAFVARADLSGNLLAVTIFGTAKNDEVRLGAPGPNGDFVVGVDMALGAEGTLLARFAANGDVIRRTYGGGQSSFRPKSMVVVDDEVFISAEAACEGKQRSLIERGIYAVPIP